MKEAPTCCSVGGCRQSCSREFDASKRCQGGVRAASLSAGCLLEHVSVFPLKLHDYYTPKSATETHPLRLLRDHRSGDLAKGPGSVQVAHSAMPPPVWTRVTMRSLGVPGPGVRTCLQTREIHSISQFHGLPARPASVSIAALAVRIPPVGNDSAPPLFIWLAMRGRLSECLGKCVTYGGEGHHAL